MRKVKIAGIGKYLPETVITSDEIDAKLGLKSGWTEKKSGVKKSKTSSRITLHRV